MIQRFGWYVWSGIKRSNLSHRRSIERYTAPLSSPAANHGGDPPPPTEALPAHNALAFQCAILQFEGQYTKKGRRLTAWGNSHLESSSNETWRRGWAARRSPGSMVRNRAYSNWLSRVNVSQEPSAPTNKPPRPLHRTRALVLAEGSYPFSLPSVVVFVTGKIP